MVGNGWLVGGVAGRKMRLINLNLRGSTPLTSTIGQPPLKIDPHEANAL